MSESEERATLSSVQARSQVPGPAAPHGDVAVSSPRPAQCVRISHPDMALFRLFAFMAAFSVAMSSLGCSSFP